MTGEDAGNQVEQADAVTGRHSEQPALGFFIRPQIDARRNRKAFDTARHAALTGYGKRALLFNRATQFGLNHGSQLAEMLTQVRTDHLERVQRIAVFGGVYLGIQNAETCLVEVTTDTRKKIWHIRRVDQYLHAFASR